MDRRAGGAERGIMKKKRLIILAAVLAAAAVYCAVPRAIVHDGYPIGYVECRGEDGSLRDVTEQVDLDAVQDLAAQYSRSAVPRPFPKIEGFDGTIQLVTSDHHGVLHIFLSNGEAARNGKPFYVAYRGNGLCYPIHDGEKLMETLREMIP